MATKKQTKTTKTVKKIEKVTDEDKIFGATDEVKIVEVVDFDSPNAKYKVTNYLNNGREIIVSGREVETFIGLDNKARQDLKEGARMVEIYNSVSEDKELMYKIEVI